MELFVSTMLLLTAVLYGISLLIVDITFFVVNTTSLEIVQYIKMDTNVPVWKYRVTYNKF